MKKIESVLVIGKNGQLASSFNKVDHLKKLIFIGQNDFNYLDRKSIYEKLNELKPQVIINCAAYTLVDLAETETDKCQKLNVDFLIYITDWCIVNTARLIHFSTDYVFDGTKDGPYIEADPVCAVNWYGKTKALGEKYLTESKVESVIFRISWVYSEFGNNFLKTMIRLGKEKENLNIVSDQIGSPCYAVNVAEVIYQWIFENNLNTFKKGIYHLATDKTISWYEFAGHIFSEYKKTQVDLKLVNLGQINTTDYKTAALRPLNSKMNSDHAKFELNLKLQSFDESLQRAIQSLLKNQVV